MATAFDAAAVIEGTNGRFFTVEFVKRTNGEVRVMTARTGVTKHLKGVGPAYSFAEKKLIGVYDVVSGGYRCIPIESIRRVVFDGKTTLVEEKT
jgi:hypothetical protein